MGVRDQVTFTFETPGKGEKAKVQYSMHSCSGYSYPFSFEQVLECGEGDLKVVVQGTYSQWNISNTHILLCPISDFKWVYLIKQNKMYKIQLSATSSVSSSYFSSIETEKLWDNFFYKFFLFIPGVRERILKRYFA